MRNPRSRPANIHTADASLWSTASSAPPESSPILAHIGPRGQGATQAARFLDRAVVLPGRHEQHENGKEDADDAVEAQGGLLRLEVEMGKLGLTSQGKSHAGLRAAQTAVPECVARPRGHRRAYRLCMRVPHRRHGCKGRVPVETEPEPS
eukprot:scaffold185_cov64-Phaeocystis_antarctica.AAC.1